MILLLVYWKQPNIIFSGFFGEKKVKKKKHLSEIKTFIITFGQFKASLLNKSINFYNPRPKKN